MVSSDVFASLMKSELFSKKLFCNSREKIQIDACSNDMWKVMIWQKEQCVDKELTRIALAKLTVARTFPRSGTPSVVNPRKQSI